MASPTPSIDSLNGAAVGSLCGDQVRRLCRTHVSMLNSTGVSVFKTAAAKDSGANPFDNDGGGETVSKTQPMLIRTFFSEMGFPRDPHRWGQLG